MIFHHAETVLVLEEQLLIAMYVEEILRDAGFDKVVTLASCASAVNWLESNLPLLVVMETRLNDGNSQPLAHKLARRNVPLIIHSVALKHANQGWPSDPCRWVDKPCAPEDLLNAVRGFGITTN